MTFDQAQSPRLGQRTPVENPGVQVVTLETLPEVAYRGQMVYLVDENSFGVYDGDAWQLTGSGGGSTVFVGPTPPVADAVGNQWLSTVDYQLYVWDGTSWVPISINRQQATNRASLRMAQAVARIVPIGTELEIVIRYQSATPTSATNDFWVNTATNTVWRWTGTAYVEITGQDATFIRLAGEARAIGVDLEIHVYYTEPMGLGPEDIGDVWHEATIRVWSGAQWVDLLITQDDLAPDSVGQEQLQENSVGEEQIIDSSIITSHLSDNVIQSHNISDFAVLVTKMKTRTHQIV